MLHLAESRGHFWRPVLSQINADIGVEHIAGAHSRPYKPLRRCGCGSLRFFGNMSAGSSASKSRTRTIPPAFSRNTISSPRRKISTSELLTLNFFGSLTAWLFPDLNTRAVELHVERDSCSFPSFGCVIEQGQCYRIFWIIAGCNRDSSDRIGGQ